MIKQIKNLVLFSFAILIFSCVKNSICPDKPEYHFFKGDELKLLWENVDSALILQNKLNTGEIGLYDTNRAYGKIDTFQFIDKSNDTINYEYRYYLIPGHNQWCINEVPMIAKSILTTIGDSYIQYIEIELEKDITDKLIYKIDFRFNDGMDLSSSFSLSDSIKIDFNIFDGYVDKSTIIQLKCYYENYQFNNENIENSLVFIFSDLHHNEKFKVIYSNKYGFLKLTKNMNYEIERHL
jgi:hypothetical protein